MARRWLIKKELKAMKVKLNFGAKLLILSAILIVVLSIGSYLTEEAEFVKSLYTDVHMDDMAAYMDFSEIVSMKISGLGFTLNKYRFIFCVPIIYPLVSVMRNNINKKASYVCAVIELALASLFLLTGGGLLSVKAKLLLASSVLFFIGVMKVYSRKDKEKFSVKACSRCKRENNMLAKFCSYCGQNI
ncbi:hypothetical protein [Fusibacter sp. JL216-2]|uniref:hypothetical protein n=1 Tax=Fusibacter sp. JL216-2 TaxID=3071453 RepID=UPI003D32D17A